MILENVRVDVRRRGAGLWEVIYIVVVLCQAPLVLQVASLDISVSVDSLIDFPCSKRIPCHFNAVSPVLVRPFWSQEARCPSENISISPDTRRNAVRDLVAVSVHTNFVCGDWR